MPPIMVKTSANPGGLPIEVFDGLRKALADNRAQFYLDFASGPFYGFNRPGAKPIPGVFQNWWRQGMMGGAKAHYDCIKAFSEADFTDDLKRITVPVLVMHGDDDPFSPGSPPGRALRPQHAVTPCARARRARPGAVQTRSRRERRNRLLARAFALGH